MTPLLLSECGDTLTVNELCRVLQISRRTYQRWVVHNCQPILPIPNLKVVRFSKSAVDMFLNKPSCVVPMRKRA